MDEEEDKAPMHEEMVDNEEDNNVCVYSDMPMDEEDDGAIPVFQYTE